MGINTIKYLGRKFFGVRNLNTTPVYDADAQAYFNANTSITSAADKNAINTFYLGLKSDGIYTKIKAMYLPIWGSAAACKWNLVNPVDTNPAFRLTFSTGWTFSSSGITGNGASSYADTNLIPSSNLTENNTHLSIYSRTNSDGLYFDCGSGKSAGQYFDLIIRLSNNAYCDSYNNTTGRILTSNTSSLGYYIGSRINSSTHKLFKNGTQLGTTNTGSSTGFSSITNTLTLSALNEGGTIKYYSSRQYAFASIGDGLTDTEANNFYSRVQTLMIYFGINV